MRYLFNDKFYYSKKELRKDLKREILNDFCDFTSFDNHSLLLKSHFSQYELLRLSKRRFRLYPLWLIEELIYNRNEQIIKNTILHVIPANRTLITSFHEAYLIKRTYSFKDRLDMIESIRCLVEVTNSAETIDLLIQINDPAIDGILASKAYRSLFSTKNLRKLYERTGSVELLYNANISSDIIEDIWINSRDLLSEHAMKAIAWKMQTPFFILEELSTFDNKSILEELASNTSSSEILNVLLLSKYKTVRDKAAFTIRCILPYQNQEETTCPI